ncbi:NAD(+) kinase [Ferrimonas balearica]|nr:NAD(+) kinase [Ferrimonas balearica]MBY6017598.1 NAD(+) kinase [Halomonas denitrificans]MBW3139901.1 NAD(+) kinase [Ferrimonas balearica]MBW3164925.1 NAD(+) kinase [Ferrimonas balearica]MBY5980207.1 NAD(+) kinase [Ferrimonas balearica]MBY6106991.1 NAD(+) kinase [Ferrimonas balearica]
MTNPFHTIGLIGKPDHDGANQTLTRLFYWLRKQGYEVLLEQRVAKHLGCDKAERVDLTTLGQRCDLAIVVGGDGNMLGAARVLSRFDVAVIGVNRGNLGFLTDLDPEHFEAPLERVLAGEFDIERRFLLQAEVYRHGELKACNTAVNEAVLHPGKVAHMIEFEVYIDGRFMYSQRADGMIVSSPTGSTAYSLSAGGAILTPNLNAVILVPMFPHTLSGRPIVVDGDSEVKLIASPDMGSRPLEVSCDGHITLAALPGDEIVIRKADHALRLIHPKGHSYFQVLRSKLGWGSKLF